MTKNTCFVDSVCWIALLNADDELHKEADTEYKKLMKSGFNFVTSTAVLNEVANALCNPRFRGSIVEFYKKLQKSHRVEIVFVVENLWSSGWDLYEKRPDKEWSLTDCVSIVIMQEQGLRDVITNDKHFEQASFNAILRKKKIMKSKH
jgi:Predicted nucleic acid-binding protein, contains PIN domain